MGYAGKSGGGGRTALKRFYLEVILAGQAEQHCDNARIVCRKADYRPELAWTCCHYAGALRQARPELAEGLSTNGLGRLAEGQIPAG